MKLTKRTGKRGSAFTVSVTRDQAQIVEEALTFLEQHAAGAGGLSPYVVQLLVRTAKRQGWRPASVPGEGAKLEGASAKGC